MDSGKSPPGKGRRPAGRATPKSGGRSRRGRPDKGRVDKTDRRPNHDVPEALDWSDPDDQDEPEPQPGDFWVEPEWEND